jgi:hypothetical protein
LGDMPSEPPLGGKTGIFCWQSGLFLAETNVFGPNVVEPQSPSNLPRNRFAFTPPIPVQTSLQLSFEVEVQSSSFDFPSWDASSLNQLPSFFLTRSEGFEPGGATPLGQMRPTDLKPPPPGPPGVLGVPPPPVQNGELAPWFVPPSHFCEGGRGEHLPLNPPPPRWEFDSTNVISFLGALCPPPPGRALVHHMSCRVGRPDPRGNRLFCTLPPPPSQRSPCR